MSSDQGVKRGSSDSSEPEIIPQKKFRKKISTVKSSGDFFDFNDGFTKARPKLSRTTLTSQETSITPKAPSKSSSKEPSQDPKEAEYISSNDGSITPPPIIFQDSDKLQNVYSRISKLDSLKKDSTSLPSLKRGTDETFKFFKISVIQKEWPSLKESEIYSDSIKSNESFNQLLSKIKVILGQEAVLMYKNTRIYPSATPNSLEYLGLKDNPRLDCFTISDFHSFQAYLSDQRQKLLFGEDDVGSEDSQDNSGSLNIKILDSSGQVLKLAAKPETSVSQILSKWSKTFNKPLKSLKLVSQGDIITGSLGEQDIEDGDTLEIVYIS